MVNPTILWVMSIHRGRHRARLETHLFCCNHLKHWQVREETLDAVAGGEQLARIQQAVRVQHRLQLPREADSQSPLVLFEELALQRAHTLLAAEAATQSGGSAEGVAR